MGSFFSKSRYVSDPAEFATLSNAEAELTAADECRAYDYIVVGAGACGAVLASRLSEDPNVTVLLVEAGVNHERSRWARMPIAFTKHFTTSFDWRYYTTPQANLNNRELFWPRGKMLGGSTSINAMMYHHCSPSDFDEWERLGAVGWGYRHLAPYFRKSECFTPSPEHPGVKKEERGDSGPWQTGFTYCSAISKKFLAAVEEVGIAMNPDINTARGTLGATKFPTFIDSRGQRSSTATAYLSKNVQARQNLTIAIETQTTRVLFSQDAEPRAIGIEIAKDKDSLRYRVAARREVILSAGAINTPQILNLSGIGAKEELLELGIEVVKDLPAIGKNLADHLASGIVLRAKKGSSLNYMAFPLRSLPAFVYWLLTGKGPATSNLAETAVFFRSTDASLALCAQGQGIIDTTSGPNAPDLELIGAPTVFRGHGINKPVPGSDTFTIGTLLLRPLSLGTVSLSSEDPFTKPVIDPKYFSHSNDLKVLLAGTRLALRIARARSFSSSLNLRPLNSPFDPSPDPFYWPADANPDELTDAELEAYIREHAQSIYHPVGTARMGGEGDAVGTVVGPDLRVHGVGGLRVVDASVFPKQVSGHPTAPLVAIAEKAADMIRDSS